MGKSNTVNPAKCNLVSFGNNHLTEITFASHKIENSYKTKCLGLIIDNKLSFKDHIDKKNKKLRQFNGLLLKTRSFFSTKQLLMFYNAYAKSIIEYGILTYGSASKTDLQSINLLQKRIIRTVSRKKYSDSVQDLAIKHKKYTVYELYAAQIFKEAFGLLRKTSPVKFLNINETSYLRTTRRTAAKLLPTVSFRSKMMEKSATRRITRVYNFMKNNELLPPDIEKMTKSQFERFFNNFKDTYLFDNYQIFEILF